MTLSESFAASSPDNTADSVMRIEDGDKVWRNNKGEIHRTDGPAIERADGSKSWWNNGHFHRIDGPAIERTDGSKEWWINGQRHRADGPAVENADGSKQWWINDQRHRTDGPAIEDASGYKMWYLNGQRHRTDGPAVELANDAGRSWWINGNELTADEISEQLEKLAAEKKARERALADAAHQRTLARLDQLAGRVTRNRRSQP